MLSKKYYKVLANLLKETKEKNESIDYFINILIEFLQEDNARFDAVRFREALKVK